MNAPAIIVGLASLMCGLLSSNDKYPSVEIYLSCAFICMAIGGMGA